MTTAWQQLDNIFSQFAICWSMLTPLNSQVRCALDNVLFNAWLPQLGILVLLIGETFHKA